MLRGEAPIADRFHDVTILFSDIVGFTRMSMRRSASDVVAMLNAIFSAVDRLALEYGIEKIKTIGDAYMAVAGLPEPRDDHAQVIARLALARPESAFTAATPSLAFLVYTSSPMMSGAIP